MTLPSHAEIVIIGGGIIGCSTAYHLARDHKADVVLLEQGKLTSGSTWHAAGLVGQLRSSASITRVLKYSVELYKGLEQETGLATGWKMTGCLRLATNPDRWTEFRRLATTAKSFGMEMHLISPADVKAMWPLMNVDDLVGASWLPTDGQASPSDITQSLARGARMHGARLHENVRVTGFEMRDGSITTVKTDKGDIACEKVVNCAGQWARQVGAMAGINVPLQPVKHQYIVTERIDGLAADAPTIRDPDRRTYFKEEVGGLVMGGYEPNPQPWTTGDVPDDWEFRLFDDDFDHFEQHMTQAIARIPALELTGVKQMINGPESFTPDGNFILGVAPECKNMFVGAGFNAFGIASGGGAGWVLAQWVVDGEAPLDLWVVDIRRFSGLHRDRQWVCDRTAEAYGKHYTIAFPHEEYESGRPRIVSPLYERLKEHRAVFGSKLGWERPNWFAPEGAEARDVYSMGRQNWFDAVGDEHRHVREAVGIFDQSSFAKYEVTGKDALDALDRICANEIRKSVGRLTYTQLLNSRGGIEADLTVARLAEEKFYIVTGTGFRAHDLGWISDHIGDGADAALTDVTEDFGTLSLDGSACAGRTCRRHESRCLERSLPVWPRPRAFRCRPWGAGATDHLRRRARLGTPRTDRRHGRCVRRLDGSRQSIWHSSGRIPRARVAAPGKILSRLGLRYHAQRHAFRGGARLGREAWAKHRFHRTACARRTAGHGARQASRLLHGRGPRGRAGRPRNDPAGRPASGLSNQRRLWLYGRKADWLRLCP